MAFADMKAELVGMVPKLSYVYAGTLINRAWGKIRDLGGWSFQFGEGGFYSPNLISAGTVSVTFASTTVTGDANASAAWLNVINPLLTLRQFRVLGFSIYNIVAVDATNPSAIKLTLDRPFIDFVASPSSLGYMIYQAYYPVPVADFNRYLSVKDMVNGSWLGLTTTRREIDVDDPQRLYFSFPRMLVDFATDQRPNSATPGFMMQELYPHPVSPVGYQTYFLRDGTDLVKESDTLPSPITEEFVLLRAKLFAYEWAEGNRDPAEARGQNADYTFLIKLAQAEFEDKKKSVRRKDRNRVDAFVSKMYRFGDRTRLPYYSSIAGRAYSGS